MRPLKTIVRAALLAGIAFTLSAPVHAEAISGRDRHASTRNYREPSQGLYPAVDMLLLRPIVFVSIPVLAGIWAVEALPWVAISNPSGIGASFDSFVGWPIQFCFRDPPGSH